METENDFLETLVGKSVKIFLIDGIKLDGVLGQVFESGDIILERGNERQLVRLSVQGTIFQNIKDGNIYGKNPPEQW